MTTCSLCGVAADPEHPDWYPMVPCVGKYGSEGMRCVEVRECDLREEARDAGQKLADLRAVVAHVADELAMCGWPPLGDPALWLLRRARHVESVEEHDVATFYADGCQELIAELRNVTAERDALRRDRDALMLSYTEACGELRTAKQQIAQLTEELADWTGAT